MGYQRAAPFESNGRQEFIAFEFAWNRKVIPTINSKVCGAWSETRGSVLWSCVTFFFLENSLTSVMFRKRVSTYFDLIRCLTTSTLQSGKWHDSSTWQRHGNKRDLFVSSLKCERGVFPSQCLDYRFKSGTTDLLVRGNRFNGQCVIILSKCHS